MGRHSAVHLNNRTNVWLGPRAQPPTVAPKVDGNAAPGTGLTVHDYAPPGQAERFTQGLSSFGQKLLERCLALPKYAGQDVMVSPLSVAVALSMLAQGALAGSAVATAFDELLCCGSAAADAAAWLMSWKTHLTGDPSVRLVLANSVWTKHGVREQYKDAVRTSFDAHCGPLEGPGPINAWVASKTHGLIPGIVETIDSDEVAVLVNVVYFKARWKSPFEKSGTTLATFTKLDGSTEPCALMKAKCSAMGALMVSTHNCTVVTLPYGNAQRFRGAFILPEVSGAAALDKCLSSLDPMLKTLDGAREKDFELYLPRFRLEFGAAAPVALNTVLEDMGLAAAFDPTVAPPCLDPMYPNNPPGFGLAVSRVLHKTVVIVNEEGTEAAAATAVGASICIIPPPKQRVVFDRPFAMVIKDTLHNTVLFAGRVTSPKFDTAGVTRRYEPPRYQAPLPPPPSPPPPLPPMPLDGEFFSPEAAVEGASGRMHAFSSKHPGLILYEQVGWTARAPCPDIARLCVQLVSAAAKCTPIFGLPNGFAVTGTCHVALTSLWAGGDVQVNMYECDASGGTAFGAFPFLSLVLKPATTTVLAQVPRVASRHLCIKTLGVPTPMLKWATCAPGTSRTIFLPSSEGQLVDGGLFRAPGGSPLAGHTQFGTTPAPSVVLRTE